MGVFEWALLGGAYAVILAVFFTVLALEIIKTKQSRTQTSQAILRSTMKWNSKIALIVFGALVFFGSPAAIIVCTLFVEAVPKTVYAFIILMVALCNLVYLLCILASFYNTVCATEEGVLVSRIFLKVQFYKYEKLTFVPSRFTGQADIFKVGGDRIFSVTQARDTNAIKLLELLKERCALRNVE